MYFDGLIIGLASFLIIGLFHPLVIKGEYHFGTGIWPVFLVFGIITGGLSVFIGSSLVRALLGVTAFCSFWTIHELFEQKERVRKGWFPVNPKRAETAPEEPGETSRAE
ncbi:DUF4491 family protein [Breznakiella homolactica]|uniref:DUF4491 family protein n=1 Tax=Breznakiella homolactica TaxID=2798577 RepID=A0A7T7XQY1_9SPIR|nr:DUF4491 family protein [Breznakiella homolactica]QQO10857.1 DUF4491 family protein [Breznakiella homolactica]